MASLIICALLCVVSLLSCYADAIRDKYRSNIEFRRLYRFPKWVPGFVARKLQDRWHIWKQVGFLLPQAALVVVVYSVAADWIGGVFAFALAVLLAAGGQVVWLVVPKPDHWE